MLLETGQPPPSTGDIALTLLAGACVSLRRAASIVTSLVPMLSRPSCQCCHREDQDGGAGVESGGPGTMSGQRGVKGWRMMSSAVACGIGGLVCLQV